MEKLSGHEDTGARLGHHAKGLATWDRWVLLPMNTPISLYGGFLRWGYPQMDGFLGENPNLKRVVFRDTLIYGPPPV